MSNFQTKIGIINFTYCGSIKITLLKKTTDKEFNTIGKKTAACTLYNYQLTDSIGTNLKIAYCVPDIDYPDVRGLEDLSIHTKIRMLGEGSRRLGIYPVNESNSYVVLKQVRPSKKGYNIKPSLQKVTMEQLRDGSGLDVENELYTAGALDIDTKEMLVNDGQDKNYLCVKFPKENKEVPIKAYIITRVFPLLNNNQD